MSRSSFNRGRPFHGSEAVMEGRLQGRTDTDYSYFFWPTCPGEEILQVLDYKVVSDGPVSYAAEERRHAKRDFIVAFELRCVRCGHRDFLKVANVGWQGGNLVTGRGPDQ